MVTSRNSRAVAFFAIVDQECVWKDQRVGRGVWVGDEYVNMSMSGN